MNLKVLAFFQLVNKTLKSVWSAQVKELNPFVGFSDLCADKFAI
jgi:hypothetical protein